MRNHLTDPCEICGCPYHTIHLNLDTGNWYFKCMGCGVNAQFFDIDKLSTSDYVDFIQRNRDMEPLGRSLVEDLNKLFEQMEGDMDE